ncbi:MAG TPA: hypothetical protein VFO19_06700 [Vicinamibacterales bacterium]|nr:hypothetical protein [Vicinamibacterales bacterium]
MAPAPLPNDGQSAENPGAMSAALTPFPESLPNGPGPHWIDVRTLCQVLIRQITARAARQHVRLSVSVAPHKAVVIGYAPVLLRALESVAMTTLDALPDGGTLSLKVYHDPYVVLECTGVAGGAELDHMTRSWRRRDEAPAMDLSAAKSIVEAHRGHLWIRHQPEGGTCVIVELPAAGPKEQYRPWRPASGGGKSESKR